MPMAILPPAKLTARSLPSIDRILRDRRSADVADGELKTDHSVICGQRFMTLRYEIERLAVAHRDKDA
jgi:hypothetical protein